MRRSAADAGLRPPSRHWLRLEVARRVSGLGLCACTAGALVGCSDPVHDDLVDKLGPEAPGVEPGPLHRPGQPCLTCHGDYGYTEGGMVFSVAGTVYQTKTASVPLVNAMVRLLDSTGQSFAAGTNCAGNFFVRQGDFAPKYPLWVDVVFGRVQGQIEHHAMGTPFYREGSCAGCHVDPPGPTSPGHVYLIDSAAAVFPPSGCQ